MIADDFLSDVEAAAEGVERARQRYEIAETVRTENSRVTLRERALAGLGNPTIAYIQGVPVRGTIVDVAPLWLAIDTEGSVPAESTSDLVRKGVQVIGWSAVEGILLDTPRFVTDGESEIGRTWNALFRACARSRAAVVWHTGSGQTFTGVIGAVGKDHVVLTSRGAHTALAALNLMMLEPYATRPERADFQKSSRMRPA